MCMPRAAAAEDVFQAIACPTRRALLDTLSRGESNVGSLVSTLQVTQSAVSQQLSVLKVAGLVEERVEGRFRFYRLRAAPLAEVESWMSRYRSWIEQSLDARGEVLDAMPDEPPRRPARERSRRTP
jgi:DNA-binding transcriptional ArsR family regulator